jgi:hypothetical protein
MHAFGQSFLQPDIAIFKQNLEALETLNSKWKLYQKVNTYSVYPSIDKTLFYTYLVNRPNKAAFYIILGWEGLLRTSNLDYLAHS